MGRKPLKPTHVAVIIYRYNGELQESDPIELPHQATAQDAIVVAGRWRKDNAGKPYKFVLVEKRAV